MWFCSSPVDHSSTVRTAISESGVKKRLFATRTRAQNSHNTIANDTHQRKTDGKTLNFEMSNRRGDGALWLSVAMVISSRPLQNRKCTVIDWLARQCVVQTE